MTTKNIDNLLRETRSFAPSKSFKSKALLADETEYQRLWEFSKNEPEKFWAEQAAKHLHWFTNWNKVLTWDLPDAKWFVGGKLNAAFNCLDRHVLNGKGEKPAIVWEGEPGDKRKLTYRELLHEVSRFANALENMGVVSGDKVTLYMPLVPELAIAVLACARIGAIHSVVFAGFSSEALADRNNDAGAKLLITADGLWRKGHIVKLKDIADDALAKSPTVKKAVVLKRTGEPVNMVAGRDVYWHEATKGVSTNHLAKPLDSEHPLFLLYTSGSTGKPKGVLHTTGGYLLGVTMTMKYVFDLKENDLFWCTADIGWVTGHSYVVYGPLSSGATIFMYEGAPMTPDPGRFWQMIERYKISILYTAPTAIRAFIRTGTSWPEKYDLSSLRLLGSVGEPINPEAWMWYHEVIGKKKCPIVDTWWQTETGGIMITPLPGVHSTVPGSACKPFFGVVPEVVDEKGKPLPANTGGYLVIKQPWPSMLRTVYGDHDRFKKQYWSHIPGAYFTGDSARRDENGNFWVMGRVDDVLNVSGHRLSTMEVESALVSHKNVAEAAVVGRHDDLKGEAIVCFVTPKADAPHSLVQDLKDHVVKQIGALARPEEIRLCTALPKTRSGKIMRRLLRDIAAKKTVTGDISTLEDLTVVASLAEEVN
ncbi:MAG: acetate--CoA ligase [Oligoflexales bacterium]